VCVCATAGSSLITLDHWDVQNDSNVGAIVEYGNCNLVEVILINGSSLVTDPLIYDKTTGQQVGGTINGDIAQSCPCGADSGTYYGQSWGQSINSDCVASSCVLGPQPLWLNSLCTTLVPKTPMWAVPNKRSLSRATKDATAWVDAGVGRVRCSEVNRLLLGRSRLHGSLAAVRLGRHRSEAGLIVG
jgi:hypothetical protein